MADARMIGSAVTRREDARVLLGYEGIVAAVRAAALAARDARGP